MKTFAVATVFALGCGGGSGGAASYEKLAREALAATTKGDAAALMRLADPDTVTRRAFACDGDGANRANAKLKKKVSERATSAIKDLDGLVLEIHEVKIDREPLSFDIATKLDEHCKLEHGNYSRFAITYSTTNKSGVVHNDKAWMDTIELDNRWYLADPPEFGGLAYMRPLWDGAGSAFASFDEEATAIGAFVDEINAAIAAAAGDCHKLDTAFAPFAEKATAIAARLAPRDFPLSKQHEVGPRLDAKIEGWTPQIKTYMEAPHVAVLFNTLAWKMLRHRPTEWTYAEGPPTNTAVDPARCAAAIKHAFGIDRAGLGRILHRDKPGMDQLEPVVVDRCSMDKWDAVALSCFESNSDFTCMRKLSLAQAEALRSDMKLKTVPVSSLYPFAVDGFEINPTVSHVRGPSGFGNVPVTIYVAMPKAPLATTMFTVEAEDLPAKWKTAKPKEVLDAEHAYLANQHVQFDKEEPVTVGDYAGLDVTATSLDEDPDLGVAHMRQRWFVRGGQLWIVGGGWMSRMPDANATAKQMNAWVEGFVLAPLPAQPSVSSPKKAPPPKKRDKK